VEEGELHVFLRKIRDYVDANTKKRSSANEYREVTGHGIFTGTRSCYLGFSLQGAVVREVR
jgi:hypothetical protein